MYKSPFYSTVFFSVMTQASCVSFLLLNSKKFVIFAEQRRSSSNEILVNSVEMLDYFNHLDELKTSYTVFYFFPIYLYYLTKQGLLKG